MHADGDGHDGPDGPDRAGDHDAFGDLVQGHSHELQVHCYRILGSLQDAEDALQETLVSAWRNLGEFGQRSSLRTWLYKIATNRCLDMLRAATGGPASPPRCPRPPCPNPPAPGPPWLEPYPDVLLDHLVDQRPGPEARYETTEAISLAFITALQLLPPRQRAALVLRDVLGYHAAEVAQMLDATQESVQSALKRARATVDNHLADSSSTGSGSGTSERQARQPGTAAEHRLVARLTDALERADLDALIGLLAADVRLPCPRSCWNTAASNQPGASLPPSPSAPAAPTACYPPAPTASPPSASTWQTPTPACTAPTPSWSSPPPATTSPPSPASTTPTS